jgi:hypothetical protein
LGAVDRGTSYSFTVQKIREEKNSAGEPIAVLKLAPGNFFIRVFFGPMYLYVNMKTFELVSFEGKTALRRKKGGDYEELVARTLYHYQIDRLKIDAADCATGTGADGTPGAGMKCSVPGTSETPSSSSLK